MRVVITGVGHWHLPLYLEPLLAHPEVQLVGVADPDAAVAEAVGRRVGCLSSQSWSELVDEARPDFVMVLGRHIDMPEVCRGLIERGIAFAVEKPAGLAAADVQSLAFQADAAGVFAAVPLVFRHSRMLELIESTIADEATIYLACKFLAGSTDRYRGGSEWMLERATSGGGAMLNLGIHFIDLARILLGPELRVEGAMMSNALDGLDVEDHGVVLLRGASGSAVIETGYTYPAPHLSFDLHFSIRSRNHYFLARDERGLESIALGEEPKFHAMPISNVQYYPVFVADVLDRLSKGRAPAAGLAELAASLRLLEAAYTQAPLPRASSRHN